MALLVASPSTSLAHGGGVPRLVDVPAGPYTLFAWTNPDPVRVGTMHLTVALAEPGGKAPVLGAQVQVEVIPLATDADARPLSAQATHGEAANKIYYEADLELPAAGSWEVAIAYTTPDASGGASFSMNVQSPSPVNWLLTGGAGMALVAIAWLLWPNRKTAEGPANRPKTPKNELP